MLRGRGFVGSVDREVDTSGVEGEGPSSSCPLSGCSFGLVDYLSEWGCVSYGQRGSFVSVEN